MSADVSGHGKVLPAGASDVWTEPSSAAEPWWLAAPAWLREIEEQDFVSRATAAYRLGDAVLHMDTDAPALVEAFPELYGDCALTGPPAPGLAAVRCVMRRSVDPPLLVLRFDEGAPRDLAAAGNHLLRLSKMAGPYRLWDSPLPGWRLTGNETYPVLAACGARAVLYRKLIPPEFLVEYLVGITLGAQSGVLSIHGASLVIGEAGVVLVGASRSSKTTTSLHLAARGHTLLGDEVALIRTATTEVVPFRRTVNLRPGPRGENLAAVLRLSGNGAPSTEEWARRHRISQVFPDSPARSATLRAVFFLAGFADRPALEPFRLTLDHPEIFSWITTPEIAYCSWGVAPERRAFRLMVLKEVLSRIPCFLVEVGPPHDTVQLIERTVEELQC